MTKYLIKLKYSQLIEAENKEDAKYKFMSTIEDETQQTFATFIIDNLKVESIPLGEKKEGESK